MSVTLEWEVIQDNGGQEMNRARVPGGWLVKAVSYIDGGTEFGSSRHIDSYVASIAFVPDPLWRWGSECYRCKGPSDQVLCKTCLDWMAKHA